jgi:spermidine synthase
MLGPLLGGSVFTFGLILAIALAGIGAGGLLYALVASERPPSLSGFAWSCLLEATAIAAAYAFGDRLAVLSLVLQSLGHAGFSAHVAGWAVVTAIVVFPAATIAGYQFPLLIALLGSGRERLGRQIGLAYATNTLGAIVGSLAGGFGLLPWLSAPGAWRFAVYVLVALGGAAMVLSAIGGRVRALLPQLALIVAAVALPTAAGPTAVWRHAGIGAGRADIASIASANQLKDWSHAQQRALVWDGDGTESSVALSSDSAGYAFVVNGKADGSARRDAGTQVMLGLLGAILNPHARRSLVIGLGTGSTAGWLGVIPAMERVDVVELEPLILAIAQACHAVNQDVMGNPKVHITLGDARETLLTTRERYDIIASEPSNPFRAGIASLFTREYYLAATDRLTTDGVFIQWVQAYDIDARTLRTLYATMASVFPYVDTWQTSHADLVLIASRHPAVFHTRELAARLAEEPFRSALRHAWRAVDLHGFLAHYVAGDRLTRAIAAAPNVDLNTDDRNVVEFGFARSVGVTATELATSARRLAAQLGAARPPLDDQTLVDWSAVDTSWASYAAAEAGVSTAPDPRGASAPELARRLALVSYYGNGDRLAARNAWQQQEGLPHDPNDLAMLADLSAQAGTDDALPFIERLRHDNAGEAATLLATLRLRQARFDEAASALDVAFREYSVDPWALLRLKQRAIDLANELGSHSPALARRMFDALGRPFALEAMREQRFSSRSSLAQLADFRHLCRDAVDPLEAHVPWTGAFLTLRRNCYEAIGDSRLAVATRDLLDFRSHEPLPLGTGVSGVAQ